MTHNRRWVWLGIAYGCVLWVFAFVCAGMGHGTLLPFAIYGAPLSLIPIVGLFLAPVWWGTLGSMFAGRRREAAAIMMILHTVTVGIVLLFGTPMEHGDDRWQYFSKTERSVPVWLWSGIAVYVVGLLGAWGATIGSWRSKHKQCEIDCAAIHKAIHSHLRRLFNGLPFATHAGRIPRC